ncbi:hypothetical protein GCM10025865_03910 [Paraoerskovia sediminicola]|uniref:precorrin-2 dehydrogenase n=1 Tax=Paraoerskovia sediminicola TaxID=1138587 RepID=A0ABM8FZL5_9CELL|nr:hypothetical protein GCM10025865_03910 [Paraoerskovia sediminicola]
MHDTTGSGGAEDVTAVADTPPQDRLYPLGLVVRDRRVVVVGGGPVAERRTLGLVGAGARVTLVAPTVTTSLRAHAEAGTIDWRARDYSAGDVDGAWLVHTATGVPEVDSRVAADAEAQRTFCVQAGDAGQGSAWVPAVARVTVSGGAEVGIAVHGGRDPRRARRVRDAVAAGLESGALPLRRVRTRSGTAAGAATAPTAPTAPSVTSRSWAAVPAPTVW